MCVAAVPRRGEGREVSDLTVPCVLRNYKSVCLFVDLRVSKSVCVALRDWLVIRLSSTASFYLFSLLVHVCLFALTALSLEFEIADVSREAEMGTWWYQVHRMGGLGLGLRLGAGAYRPVQPAQAVFYSTLRLRPAAPWAVGPQPSTAGRGAAASAKQWLFCS